MPGYGLLTDAKFRGVDDNGAPLSSGLLYTYEPGGVVAKTTYQTPSGTANTNPVILDSRGEADVWLDGETKLVLKDKDGVTIWTVDNVPGIGNIYLDPITNYDSSLATAITDIGATEKTLLIDRAVTVSADASVPETLNLWFTRAGSLTIAAGKTVTIASQVTAGNWAIFDGDGNVSGLGAKNDPVNAGWFGTTAAKVNKAISAIGSTETSLLFDGTFTIDADVTTASTTTVRYGRKATFTISVGKTLTVGGPIDYEASPFQNVIQSGLIVRPNSPADMAGDVDSGYAWDSKGHLITVGTSQAVNFALDRDANATVPSAGLQRYITLIARIAREWHGAITYDPVTGTNRQPYGGTQFVLETVSATAAASSPARYVPQWDEVVLCDVLLTSSTTAVTYDMIDFTRRTDLIQSDLVKTISADSNIPTTFTEHWGFYAITSYDGGSQPLITVYDPDSSTAWPVGPVITQNTAAGSTFPNGAQRFDPDTGYLYVKQGGAEQVVKSPLRYEDLSTYYVICSSVNTSGFQSTVLTGHIHADAVAVKLWFRYWSAGNLADIYVKTDDTNFIREYRAGGNVISAVDFRGTDDLPIGSAGWAIQHRSANTNVYRTIYVIGEWRG